MPRRIAAGVHTVAFNSFRSEWILQRRHRPSVPCPMRTPLPHGRMTREGRGRLCNIYLRPWVLHHPWATTAVPHITHLDRVPVPVESLPATRYKIMRKSADPNRVEVVGHRKAWKHYIRGNVVSETSVTLITNFLNACSAMAKHKEEDDERDDGEDEATGPKPLQFSTTTLSVQQVHGIVQEMASLNPGKKVEGLKTSKTLTKSLQIGRTMWSDLPQELSLIHI